jgi:surfactin synthase thioesterase subunit
VTGGWLAASRTEHGARARVVCFPWGGGNPRAYLDWQPDLAAVARVQAVCLPGRAERESEPAPANIAVLADAAAAAIRGDDRPTILFGHSMGAIVAFEVARRLAGTAPVAHLVVSGCPAPCLMPTGYLRWAAGLDRPALAAAAARFEGLPQEVVDSPELQALLMTDLETDLRLLAAYSYRPAPSLRCGVTLANGRDDWHVAGAALDGWARECVRQPTCAWFDGGHLYLTERPYVLMPLLSTLLADVADPVEAATHVEVI